MESQQIDSEGIVMRITEVSVHIMMHGYIVLMKDRIGVKNRE
jgi:hypothetical protein